MVDVDTFLTILYVLVDDFCKTACSPSPTLARRRPSAGVRP
jgi:hypothetical protein